MPPRSLPEGADRMVAVDDHDPPPEAKIKTESTAAPSSALPGKALAAAASSAWGERSTDELPDDNDETYGEAEEHPAYAYAYNRAAASFRRFAKGMQYASPTSCHPCAQRTDVSTVVPELAHKPMHAPKNLDNIRNLVNIRKRNERRDTFFEIACASQSFMHARPTCKLPKNDAGRVCSERCLSSSSCS